jgi:hypothetical protein
LDGGAEGGLQGIAECVRHRVGHGGGG